MADGNIKIAPEAARAKAADLKSLAGNVQELLENVSKKMEEIDSIEHGVYQGDNRPAQLRQELDSFRAMFNAAHEQIIKFADNIIEVANKSENE